jgi:hypothetical protein
MDELLRAANSPGIAALIDSFYGAPEVEGFALGVHSRFLTLFRSEFRNPSSVNSILKDERRPKAWEELCTALQYTASLSPIYVAMYINISVDEFRVRYPNLPNIALPDYAVFLETIDPFVAYAPDRVKHRPKICGGLSAAAYDSAQPRLAGTLGGIIEDARNSTQFLLSCNHVFLTPGHDIRQQAPGDGGTSSDSVAQTKYEVPFCATTALFTFTAPFNTVDAAIAEVNHGVTTDPAIRLLSSKVTGVALMSSMALGDDVVFVGKESDFQDANVHHFIARIKVAIHGTTRNFGNVFEIRPRRTLYLGSLVQPGDSGSWVVQELGTGGVGDVYGLFFAGNGSRQTAGLCCFMENVVDELEKQASSASGAIVKYRPV